jgi:hypothetical protein
MPETTTPKPMALKPAFFPELIFLMIFQKGIFFRLLIKH